MDPIRFRCPDCHQALKVRAENAGRKVRCNRCSNVVIVPIPEADDQTDEPDNLETEWPTEIAAPRKSRKHQPPAEEEDPEEEDQEPNAPKRKSRKKARVAAWRLARLGILLLMIGSALSVLGALTVAVVWVLPLRVQLSILSMLVVAGIVVPVLLGLLKIASFSLCLFAPPESESKTFAIIALVATVLSNGMSAYLTADYYWWARRTFPVAEDLKAIQKIKEDQERLRDPKEREKFLKEMQEQLKKMTEQSNRMIKDNSRMIKDNSRMIRVSILNTVSSLLNGLYLISVPLLLRSFCRALLLKRLEPNCEALLKFGAGLIFLHLVLRLLGMFVLGGALMFLGMLLTLAYVVQSLVVMFQLWRAMPAPRG